MTLQQWAERWGLHQSALQELNAILEGPATLHKAPDCNMSEDAVDQRIELSAPTVGGRLWRNNTGVAFNSHNVPVRFGIMNDSKQMNERIKGPDRLGPVLITIGPQHMGKRLGVFFGVEVKPSNWTWKGTKRERAQWAGLSLINSLGGVGIFATHPDHFLMAVNNLKAGI